MIGMHDLAVLPMQMLHAACMEGGRPCRETVRRVNELNVRGAEKRSTPGARLGTRHLNVPTLSTKVTWATRRRVPYVYTQS